VQSAATGPSGGVYELERVKSSVHAAVMRYTFNRDTPAS